MRGGFDGDHRTGDEHGRPVTFLGDGVPVFAEQLAQHCRVAYDFAPAHMNRQRAASLCALAELYYQEGRIQSADEHRPDYLRLSQAERERLERERMAQASE